MKKTIVELRDWDGYLVADAMERDGSELAIYSKYMSVATAIDLLSKEGVINRFDVCDDCGCQVSVGIDQIKRIYIINEED